MKCLVSVIVPVYNTERFLHRCVDSILKQSLSDMEVILVDDGSTDSSGTICDEYKKSDRCVRVIHKKNAGVSKARNDGLEMARGKYITFVDSDDFLPDDPHIYSNAISLLEENDVDIVAWLWQYQNKNGQLVVDSTKIPEFFHGKMSTREFVRGLYYGSYGNGLVVCVSNKMFKKDFIAKQRFEYQIFEDDDWMTKLLAKEGTVFCQNDFWYVYSQNEHSLTHSEFSEARYAFLDILKNRVCLFNQDSFIKSQTMKLYIEIYIEYWFKGKQAKIKPYSDMQTYKMYLSQLNKLGDLIRMKDRVRYTLFKISPKLYELFVFKLRKILRKQ